MAPNYKEADMETFLAKLRKNSLKATPQRIAVHEAMMKLGHASADMVTEEIESAGNTRITTASVYNILTQMAQLGIYASRMSRNNKMYFDVNTYKHAHVYDCENSSYKDLIDEELMDIIDEYLGRRKFRGYKVEGIDIQLLVRPTKRKSKQI